MADPFIPRWTVDVDCMPEMLLTSIVTDRRSNHLQQATLSVNWCSCSPLFTWFYFRHSFPIHSSSTNSLKTFVKSFMIRDGLLTKLSKKMLQYMFSRHSVKTRTPLGPRFSSLLSFLPKCKSNWYRYPVLVAQRYQNLNPHCIGLLFTYCLILDLLLI